MKRQSMNSPANSVSFFLGAVLLILLLTAPGCSFVQIVVNSGPESQLLREGEKALKAGNYTKAENLFQEVYLSDAERSTRNTALYNLACTRMLLAENINDVTSAIALLDGWKQTYPSGIYTENPDYVISALQHSRELILEEADQAARFEEKVKKSDLAKSKISNSYRGQQKLVEDLTAQLQSLETTAMEYRKQIETLQNQKQELEEIDQQMEEKKKPL